MDTPTAEFVTRLMQLRIEHAGAVPPDVSCRASGLIARRGSLDQETVRQGEQKNR